MSGDDSDRGVKYTRPGRADRELELLGRVAEALNSAPDVERALEKTLALVAELLGLETGWVWLLDPETDRFYSAAARNLPPYLQEPVRMTGAPCWCIESFSAGRLTPQNIRLIQCSRLCAAVTANEVEATRGLCCHASIPLAFQERRLGIMNLTAPAWRKLTPAELRWLEMIAYQVGSAIERARLAEERTMLARAEERARLAREIHDTLVQGLTGIGLQIEGALPRLRSNPDEASERLRRALELTRANLEEARRAVLDLRAAPLGGRALEEALRALVRAFAANTGIRSHLRVDPALARDLPLQVEAELFRIAQEALANVRHHSGASTVTVELTRAGEGLRLAVRDDGVGLTAPGAKREAGYGILGMRERARLLGGRLRITARRNRGTTVVAEVPLPSPGTDGRGELTTDN